MGRSTWIAGVLFCMVVQAWAQAPIPAQTGYLTDRTGRLGAEEQIDLQLRLAEYEIDTGRRLAVLLVPGIAGERLDDYADAVVRAWYLDRVAAGAALLLWSSDGYVVIRAAGPALERLDAEAQTRILTRRVVPTVAAGELGTGLRQGVEGMIAVLDGDDADAAGPADPVADHGDSVAQADPLELQSRIDRIADAANRRAAEAQRITAEALAESAATQGRLPPVSTEADVPPASAEQAASPPMRLAAELERLHGGFTEDFCGGLSAWWQLARAQAVQLVPRLRQAVADAVREVERNTPDPVPLAALAVLAVALLAAGILLLRGALVPAGLLAGIVGGIATGLVTGFAALGGLLVLMGLASPLLVPALRVLLRRADHERGAGTGAAHTLPRPFQPRVPETPPRPPAPGGPDRNPRRAGDQAEQVRRVVERLRQSRGVKLRPVHIIVLVVLFIIHPLLGILGVVGLIAYLVHRTGIAPMLVDLAPLDAHQKAQWKARMNRPRGGDA